MESADSTRRMSTGGTQSLEKIVEFNKTQAKSSDDKHYDSLPLSSCLYMPTACASSVKEFSLQ